MNLRRALSGVLTAALVVVVVALIVGQLVGQPVLLGYVTTGSMEPTLSPGDGFIAVPSQIAGEPEPGDVVVFEAESIQGGGLTTHRVIAETDRGYVTKGDANPFTDQDGGEPYVTRQDVVAHALQINGWVVTVPGLGTVISGIQGLIAIPFALVGTDRIGSVMVFFGILLFLLAGLWGGEQRRTGRSRNREDVVAVWMIVLFAAGIVTMTATAAMVLPAGGYDIDVLVTEDPTSDTQVVGPGETAAVNYEVHNGGVIPVLVVTEQQDERTRINPQRTSLGFDERQTVQVRIEAPEESGEYTRSVSEHRYLLVLPEGVLLTLHSVHPFLAILAVDFIAALFVITIAFAVFGTGYLRMRSGSDLPLRIRISRRLRRYR